MEKAQIPIWEKAALSTEETAAYMDVHVDLVRALALASKHGMNDFPAFWVGTSVKVARLPLLSWIADTAMSHRDLKRAAAIVENAQQVETARKRGRPRKRITEGRYEINA
jgi:hypothetical protein